MSELREAGYDIANGVEARLLGFHICVRMDEAALDLGFRFLQPDIFGERTAPHSDEYFFGRDRLRFSSLILVDDGRALRIFFHRLDLGFELDLKTLFPQC